MLRWIAAGLRYRIANGLGRAMRLWGTLIVAAAVAADLNAQPAIDIWIRTWQASRHPVAIAFALAFAIAIAVQPTLVRALRSHGQRDVMVLPLTRAQRFAIDGAAVTIFMVVPYGALLGAAVAARLIAAMLVATIAALTFLVLSLRSEEPNVRVPRSARFVAVPDEVRWLLRGRGIGGAAIFAIVAMAAAQLAIHNNRVISIDSASRIRGAFAAVAALILAIAIMRVRTAMRPFRAAEVALPLSSRRRLRALCTASLAVAFPLIAAGLAAPFAFVLLLALVLLGEHFALRARRGEWQLNVIGAWAAVIAAINIVAATIAAIGLLLYAWQRAVAADRTCDAPVVTEPE